MATTFTDVSVSAGKWSFDGSSTATLTLDNNGGTITLKGLEAFSAQDDFKKAIEEVAIDTSKKTVTLKSEKLFSADNTITIDDNSGGDYKLALASGLATNKELDAEHLSVSFAKVPADAMDENVTGKTVTIKGKTKAYYDLTDGGASVTYHAPSNEESLANITGLSKSAVESGDSASVKIDTDNKTIKLFVTAFDTANDANITLSVVENAVFDGLLTPTDLGFKLALGFALPSNNLKDEGNSWDTKNGNTSGKDNEGTATYNHTVAAGYTVSDNAISYKKAVVTKLFELTGLKTGIALNTSGSTQNKYVAIKEGNSEKQAIAIDDETKTVKIYKAALPNEEVTLPQSSGYTFKLAEDENDAVPNDGKIGHEKDGDNGWSFANNQTSNPTSGTATYQYKVKEGWTLDATSNKITHEVATIKNIVTISGLKPSLSNATASDPSSTITGIGVDTAENVTTFTISKEALATLSSDTTEAIKLETKDGVTSGVTYKLALGKNIDTVAKVDSSETAKVNSLSTTGTATITGKATAYYTLDETNADKVSYKAAATATFATITGLKSDVTDTTKITITAGTDGSPSTITLKDDVLPTGVTEGSEIKLEEGTTVSDNPTYKLSLDSDTNKATKAKELDTSEGKKFSLSIDNGTATIKGTAKEWYETTDNVITYHEPEEIVFATISGLGTDAKVGTSATDASTTVIFDDTTNTIKLKKGALTGTTEGIQISKAADVTGNPTNALKFQFVGDDGSTSVTSFGFGPSDRYWSASNGTATYQYHTAAGWRLYDNGTKVKYSPEDKTAITDVLQITGLPTTFKTDNDGADGTIAGITPSDNDGNKTITLSAAFLKDNVTDSITLVKKKDTGYSLKIGDGTSNTVGAKDSTDKYWYMDKDGVTRYQYDTSEGWELKGNVVSYIAAKTDETGTAVAQIIGLKSGLTKDQLAQPKTSSSRVIETKTETDPTDLSKNTITVTLLKGALDETIAEGKTEGKIIEIKPPAGSTDTNTTYKLALATGIDTLANNNIDTDVHFHVADTTSDDSSIEEGTAVVKSIRGKGWVENTDKTKLTYYGAINKELAKVSGLKADASKNNVTLGTEATNDATTIYIAQDALTDGNVTLTSDTYKLALKGSTATPPTKLGFAPVANAWKAGASSTEAVYYSSTEAGWDLNTDGKGITYTKAEDTHTTLATVKGLKEGYNSSDLTVTTDASDSTKKTITVKEGALAEDKEFTVSVDVPAGATDTYKLVFDNTANFDGGSESKVSTDGTTYNKKTNDPKWTVETKDGETVATYTYTENGYWTLNKDGKITYTEEKTTTLATITGLNSDVTADKLKNIVTADSSGEYKGTITLTKDLLGDGDIKLTVENGGDYTLSFGKTGGVANKTLGFSNKDTTTDGKWSVEDGKAIRTHTVDKGWTLTADGKSATFTAATPVTLATIEGLKDLRGAAQLSNVTVTNDSGNPTKITLVNTLIDKTDEAKITLTNGDKDATTKFNYRLVIPSLEDTAILANGDSTISVSDTDASTGKATVVENRTAGWTADADKTQFTYHEAIDNKILATVKGLKASFTAAKVTIGTAANNDANTIYIEKDALDTTNVTLESDTYTLALKDGLDGKTFGFNEPVKGWQAGKKSDGTTDDSSVAIYYATPGKGWTLDEGNKGITYTSAEDNRETLATVTGLADTLTDYTGFEVVTGSDGNYFIKLPTAALATGENVEIKVEKGEGAASTDTYSLAFAIGTGDKAETKGDVSILNKTIGAPSWTVVDGEGGTKTATYAYTTSGYWTLKDGKITYTPAASTTLATITGLNSDVTADKLKNIVTADSSGEYKGTINFTDTDTTLFGDGDIKLTVENGGDYKLSFGMETDGTTAKTTLGFDGKDKTDNSDNKDFWTVDDSTATYKHNVGKGWTLAEDGKSAAYTGDTTEVLATITNLNNDSVGGIGSKLKSVDSNDNTVAPYIDGIDVDSTNKVIKLKESVLSKNDKAIELTNGTGTFTLKLDDGTNAKDKLGQDAQTPKWYVKDGVARYQHDVNEGWDVKDNKITYVAAKTGDDATVLAEISGLNNPVVAGDKIEGIDDTTTANTFTLDNNILGTKDVTLTNAEGKSYKLDLVTSGNNAVIKNDSTQTDNIWTYDNGTAIYKKINKAYYQQDVDNFIAYHEEKDVKELAKLTDLATKLAVSDDRNAIVAKVTNADGTTEDKKVVKVTTASTTNASGEVTKGVITVHNAALANKSVTNSTDSSEYNLELASDVSVAEMTDTKWTVKKDGTTTTATLNGNLTAGYEVNGKSITYNASNKTETLLTITGLKADIDAATIEDNIFIDGEKKVTISNGVLGASDVTVSDGYTLELDSGVNENSTESAPAWHVDGNTATYKTVIPTYYTLSNDKRTLKHTAEVDKTVYVTVEGLTPDADGNIQGLTVDTATNKIKITSGTENSLGTTDAKIKTDGYTFELVKGKDSSNNDIPFTPTYEKYTWSTDSKATTATLKAKVSAGYTLNNDKNTLKYSAADDNATVLTVTGLAGVTISNAKTAGVDGTNTGTENSIYIGKATNAITFKAATFGDSGLTTAGTVALPDAAFAGSDIKITGGKDNYSFDTSGNSTALVMSSGAAPTTSSRWRVDGTTAIYANYTPAYYKLDDATDTITYHKEVWDTSNLAEVSGLPSGIKVNSEGTKVVDSAGKDVVEYDGTNKKIVLGEGALAEGTINLKGQGDYKEFATDDASKKILTDAGYVASEQNKPVWSSISNGTATLTTGSTAGYTLSDNALTYSKATAGKDAVATVTGLQTSLKINSKGELYRTDENTPVVTFGSNNTIKLSDEAFGTKNIELKNSAGQNYTLAYGGEASNYNSSTKTVGGLTTGAKAWSVSGTTATLRDATSTAAFKLEDDDKKFTYTAAKTGSAIAKITGIKKNTVADTFGNIDGVVVSDKKVTLSANVLDPKNTVKISTGYTLALDTSSTDADKKVDTPPVDKDLWYVSGTTVTYGTGKTAGYSLKDNQITYSALKAATNPVIKITGVKSGLQAVDGDLPKGIVVGSDKDSNGKYEIKLSKDVLNKKTITLATGKDSYKLVLDTDAQNLASTSIDKWSVSGTTATLRPLLSTGYTVADDGSKITYAGSATNGTAKITLTGLKKGLKVGVDGNIEGIEVATDASDNTKKVITLDNRVLGTSSVKVKESDYTLKLDKTTAYKVDETKSGKMWSLSGTTATYRPTVTKGYELVTTGNNANKEIKYTAASNGKALATVTGVKSVDSTAISVAESKDSNSNKFKITVNESALNGANVKLTKGGDEYELALGTVADNGNTTITLNGDKLSSGTAIFNTKTTDKYELKNGEIVFTAGKESKMTITGLDKNLAQKTGDPASTTLQKSGADVVTVDSTDKTITVKKDALSTSKVTLSGGDYKLVLDGETGVTKEWIDNGNGTYTYQATVNPNSYYCDGTSITYLTNGGTRTLATVTGLQSGLKAGEGTNLGKLVSADGSTVAAEFNTAGTAIILNSKALQNNTKNTAKITSNAYTLGLSAASGSDDTLGVYTSATSLSSAWVLNGTTATYGVTMSDYYTLADDGKSVSYTAAKPSSTLVTLSGLKKNSGYTSADLNAGLLSFGGGSTGIVVSDKLFGTTNITLKNSNGSKYEFSNIKNDEWGFNGISTATKNTASIFGGASISAAVYYSGTKLTIENGTYEKWEISGTTKQPNTTIKHTAETHGGKGKVLATVSGINSKLETSTEDGKTKVDGIEIDGKTITLTEDALNKKAVTLSTLKESVGGGYSLALALDVPVAEQLNPAASFNKTTIVISADTSEGYSLKSGTSITYSTKKTGKTIAKVTGLKNDPSSNEASVNITYAADVASSIGVIELSDDALNKTKVALTTSGASYILALDDSVVTLYSDAYLNDTTENWKASGSTTVTLNKTTPEYYTLNSNGKSVTFTKKKTAVDTKITGVKFSSWNAEDGADGISLEAPEYTYGDGKQTLQKLGIINLDESVLDNKTVKVTGNYVIQADYESPEMDNETLTVAKSGGRATLKGSLGAGYTLSGDKKTLTYSKLVKSTTLATITGLSSSVKSEDDLNIDKTDNVINLSKEDISGNTITVGGKYSFNFASDYENGTIKGSTGSDAITVGGVGISITAGKGDDYITLNNNSSNGDTVIYASGDGNDVITNFGSADKLQITGAVLSNDSIFSVDDDDLIIKVGAGSIRLEDVKGSNIEFANAKTTKATLETGTIYWNGSAYTLTDPSKNNSNVFESPVTPTSGNKK